VHFDGKEGETLSRPRLLGVLLCYNDGDLLEDSIRYLLEQNHHVIAWDHGSTDETGEVIRRFGHELLETRFVPREFDFYELYPAMSRHLLEHYVASYDWISWPDQDEFLEGPSRSVSYCESIQEPFDSNCNWIEFRNYNYWFTSADDVGIKSRPPGSGTTHFFPTVRHGSVPGALPRLTFASSIIIPRWENHGPSASICVIIQCDRETRCCPG